MSLVFVSLLSACSTDDTYLPALLADPMAEYEAEGIELIVRDTQGYVARDVLGNTVGARVFSNYRIFDQSATDDVLESAIAAAENHGWEMEPGTRPTNMVGFKDLDVGVGELLLVITPEDPQEPDGSPMVLHVFLGFSAYDSGN